MTEQLPLLPKKTHFQTVKVPRNSSIIVENFLDLSGFYFEIVKRPRVREYVVYLATDGEDITVKDIRRFVHGAKMLAAFLKKHHVHYEVRLSEDLESLLIENWNMYKLLMSK